MLYFNHGLSLPSNGLTLFSRPSFIQTTPAAQLRLNLIEATAKDVKVVLTTLTVECMNQNVYSVVELARISHQFRRCQFQSF
jgi:hypothetical protein